MFLLWLYRLIGKPIKIDLRNKVSEYYVTDIESSISWDNVKIIKITLKTI